MNKSHFIEAAIACLSNGRRLLEDAEMLEFVEPPRSSFVLAMIAQEEFAKGFLLFLVSRGVIPWTPQIYRATRDHVCKQVLGIVMGHMNPDTDEFLARMEEWRLKNEEQSKLLDDLREAQNREEQASIWEKLKVIDESRRLLPPTVADAINILRHEKIRRWEYKNRIWAEEPKFDTTAKRVADGKLDREKQDALYIRLDKKGKVVQMALDISPEVADEAKELANRMGNLVERLLSGEGPALLDYEKIESAFKAVFADSLGSEISEPDST